MEFWIYLAQWRDPLAIAASIVAAMGGVCSGIAYIEELEGLKRPAAIAAAASLPVFLFAAAIPSVETLLLTAAVERGPEYAERVLSILEPSK